MKALIHIIQFFYLFVGFSGIIKYTMTKSNLSLMLAILLISGGIISFLISSWWPLLLPLIDIPIRAIVYSKEV